MSAPTCARRRWPRAAAALAGLPLPLLSALHLPLAVGLLLPWSPALQTPAVALELQGQTWFSRPPWRVLFRSYYWYVMQTGVEYYFTLTLPEQAGAGLGGLEIQQTRGVDTQFPFMAERSRAFVGEPRREGAVIPVQASFDEVRRRFSLRFPTPPQPGQTITVALRPWHNPSQADTYMFSVQALPAGPNPVPASLGFATMPIYDALRF
ncbi:MAG: hypothetical protein RLZZ124_344 [Cyanobacteriota bacterium]|jgi:hypothetical protein